jgi:hypothetical protein
LPERRGTGAAGLVDGRHKECLATTGASRKNTVGSHLSSRPTRSGDARSGRWPGPQTEKNRRATNRSPCWWAVGSDGLGRPRLPPWVGCHWLAMRRAIAPPIRADKWARRGRHALPRLGAWSGRRGCTGWPDGPRGLVAACPGHRRWMKRRRQRSGSPCGGRNPTGGWCR